MVATVLLCDNAPPIPPLWDRFGRTAAENCPHRRSHHFVSLSAESIPAAQPPPSDRFVARLADETVDQHNLADAPADRPDFLFGNELFVIKQSYMWSKTGPAFAYQTYPEPLLNHRQGGVTAVVPEHEWPVARPADKAACAMKSHFERRCCCSDRPGGRVSRREDRFGPAGMMSERGKGYMEALFRDGLSPQAVFGALQLSQFEYAGGGIGFRQDREKQVVFSTLPTKRFRTVFSRRRFLKAGKKRLVRHMFTVRSSCFSQRRNVETSGPSPIPQRLHCRLLEGAADVAGVAVGEVGALDHQHVGDTLHGIDPCLRAPRAAMAEGAG